MNIYGELDPHGIGVGLEACPPDFKKLIPERNSLREPPVVTALRFSTAFELMLSSPSNPNQNLELLGSVQLSVLNRGNRLWKISDLLLPHIQSCDLSLHTPLYEFKSDTCYSGDFP